MTTPFRTPRFPRLPALPLRLLPQQLPNRLAAGLLERLFAEQRADGELDFLRGRTARIRVTDLDLSLTLRGGEQGLQADTGATAVDVQIEGLVYDYLLLISGREDPDTLFFQRRLRMSGDTALGVHLKNFLASVDPDSLPLAAVARPGLERGLRIYERLLG
jgi:predicted lipid carrier protein YhbT